MKLPGAFRWAVVLMLLLAVLGGGALCWFWVRSDQLIHTAVVDAINKRAPDWDIEVERTRFDGTDKLHLFNVSVRDVTDASSIVTIPEAIVTLDRDQFVRDRSVVIRHVRVRKPTVRIARAADGTWNLQRLPPLRKPPRPHSLPEWDIEDARLDIRLDYGDQFPTAGFSLRGASATLVPAARRTFDFDGRVRIDNAGDLKVVGKWDVDRGAWKVTGQMNNLIAGDDLIKLAASSSPEVSDRLAHVRQMVQQTAERWQSGETRVASTDRSLQVQAGMAPAFGVAGQMNVRFDVTSPGGDRTPRYRVLLGLSNGTVNNPILPFGLHDVTAQVYRDNDLTFVSVRNARNDQTQLQLEASVGLNSSGEPAGFVTANVRDLPLDDRVRRVLPVSWRKLLAPLNATGTVSCSGKLRADGAGVWIPEGCRLDLQDGTSLFEKFRYPVQRISGSMVQRDGSQLFDIDMRGVAGARPITLTGQVRDPGPAAEMSLTIKTDKLPLDDVFRNAWDEQYRRTVDLMGVTGVADATVAVYREPVVGARSVFRVDATVSDGRLHYAKFPYTLNRFGGRVVYASKTGSFLFEDLEGYRGDTRVTGEGWINGEQGPGQLHLDVRAENARFDKSLRRALDDDLQEVWDQISPTGVFDADLDIDWRTDETTALVTVPNVTVRGGSIYPQSFPYRLKDVNATLRYDPVLREDPDTGRVTIEQLRGRHGDTTVDAAGWADHRTNGDWTLHFDRLVATNVVANSDLVLAMPEGLRDAFQVLNPTAPFGIENTELEFRGRADPTVPVTAAWYTETVLDGGVISAGMDLKKVRGRVTNSGTYGPEGLVNQGEVRLDSVEVLDHTLTNVRGPYRIVDTQLSLGSPDVFVKSPQAVPVKARIRADAFTGQLTCDGLVNLSDPGAYRVFVTAQDADLREYARTHMPAERDMKGKMNGWIYLYGLGASENDIKGRGQLQISPAAIYEMPLIGNLLNAVRLDFTVPDRVAFRYGLLNFRVANSNFVFDEIDLVGNSISFRGRGRVGFDSRVNLDFYSKPPRSGGGIPIISQLVSGATSTWVHVKVDGTLDQSRTRVQPNINLDGALQPFLQAFDPRMNVPQMRIPLTARPGPAIR